MEQKYCHQIIIGVYHSGVGSYMKTDFVVMNEETILNRIFHENDKKGNPIVYINVPKDISGFDLWNVKKELTNEFLNLCLKKRKETKKWMLERLEEIKKDSTTFKMIEFLESMDVECLYKNGKSFFVKKNSLIKMFGREDIGIINIKKMLEIEFNNFCFLFENNNNEENITIKFNLKPTKE